MLDFELEKNSIGQSTGILGVRFNGNSIGRVIPLGGYYFLHSTDEILRNQIDQKPIPVDSLIVLKERIIEFLQ